MRAAVFVSGIVLTVIACSTSSVEPPPAQTTPDGGSSGTPDTGVDANASSSGTTSSGGTSDASDGAPVDLVKNTTIKMQHAGDERTYVLSVPTDYDASKKYPLYVWLHGHPGSAEGAAGYRIDKGTKNEAIIAYPGALSGYWDHSAGTTDNADVTFIFAMIDAIEASHNIDSARILLGGWSGGGFMAGLVACRHYGSFRAIAIEAGGAPFDPGGGANPACNGASIATIVTHGGQDNTVGPDSGYYAAEYWQSRNGCNGSKAASGVPLCEDYASCDAATPTRYCIDPNWGHAILPNAFELEWNWFKALP